ncbi:hypothetical protein Purlil1_13814 [Purpureocillium lilacinum]|uniref:Protein kinase domain-containing protein n=1 Tax=Purpureocillium lilacinum TaxID=33203 RepID=A0ABR0BD10_PURLI|nr:hypothetical protein Purlil1_13814 [Purpureocillium lilacinum]
MADSPASSQRTNEDPTGPTSVAARATATLTPANAEAKLAFSDVVEAIIHESQGGIPSSSNALDPRTHAQKYMWIPSEQSTDFDVARLLRYQEVGQLSSSSPSASPANTAATPDDASGAYIWRGCYFLDLHCRPLHPARGWTVGRLNWERINDISLSPGTSSESGIRRQHCILQVHAESGRIFVQKIRDQGVLEVDGVALSPREIRVLNNPSTSLRIGQMLYNLEYARFAHDEEYDSILAAYIRAVHGSPTATFLPLTPTPTWAHNFQVGQWTITGAGTIGSGSGGRVSAAMNRSGKLVVLKRTSTAKDSQTGLQKRCNTLRSLTKLADEADRDDILRLLEIITDDPAGSNYSADVWFVLEPAVVMTVYDHRGISLRSTTQGIEKTTSMVKAILEALDFLHSRQWIHGDIKPPNIGIRKWESAHASIVLLDLDDAVHAPEHYAPPAPGRTGTVGWLSPERELTGFSYTADVWAVGITAIWLLCGQHPWPCAVNPWRVEPEYQLRRPNFHDEFDKVVDDFERSDFGVLGKAILRMIRHPYARNARYRGQRDSSKEILRMLETDDRRINTQEGRPSKRAR